MGPSPITEVIVADLNSDGALDVAVTNFTASSVSVLVNQGDGTFGAAVEHPAGAGPASVAAADLNGDGAPDLVVADHDINKITVLLNDCLP